MIIARAILLAVTVALSPVSATRISAQEVQPPSVEASLDTLVKVLRDDQLRAELLQKLETMLEPETPTSIDLSETYSEATSSKPEADAAREAAQEVIGGGLLTGVQQWATDLGERLPTAALGAPIGEKLEEAVSQLGFRLDDEAALEDFKQFGLWSALGWALISVVAFSAMGFVRNRVRGKVARDAKGRALGKEAAKKGVYSLLPLAVCVTIGAAWANLSPFTQFERSMFVLLTVPLAGALAASGVLSSALVLLVPSKGARLVSYAQRRLSPLFGMLIGVALAGSVAATAKVRIAIGPAAGDILSLLLDLAVPCFAIFVIAYHRRTVRSLIVKGYSTDDEGPVLDRAIHWFGTHWQHFGFVFAALNIGARLFGSQTGNFLTQSSLSVGLIVLAFIGVTSVRRLEQKRRNASRRRTSSGMRSAVLARFSTIVYRALQVLVCVAAFVVILRLWGIYVLGWLASSAGSSVVGPVFSIVFVVLFAWMLWVILDAWITAALSPAIGGNQRERSARVKTLLPLLRNVAFVVLSVLTVIGVLANLGINVAPLIAGAGVVGLAVGFGSQQLVADVITGLFILLEDTLAIGDVVNTGDRSGTVEALTIRTMKIRDGDGSLHSVPFSTVKALKNSSRGFGVYTVTVTLDLEANVDDAIAAFKEVGEEVSREPNYRGKIIAPLDVWGVDQVGPDGIVLKGAIKTMPLQQYGVGREINRRLNAKLQERGVPLASRNPSLDTLAGAVPA